MHNGAKQISLALQHSIDAL